MSKHSRSHKKGFFKPITKILALLICAIILVLFALYKLQPTVYYFIVSDTLNLVSSATNKKFKTEPYSLQERNKAEKYAIRDQLMRKTIEEKARQKETQRDKQEFSQNEKPFSFDFIKKDKLNNSAILAIIVDDGGYRVDFANRLASLNIPLTWAIMPYESNTEEFANIASEHNIPYLVHFPMQAEIDKTVGTNDIGKGMSSDEIRAKISTAFSILPNAIGLNNHRGSLATSDKETMQPVVEEIKSRNKIFVDSRTSTKSVAYDIAKEAKMVAFLNQGFLDGDSDEKAIESNFNKIVEKALKNGNAIVICHFRPTTIFFLEKLDKIKETIPVTLVTIPQMAEIMYEKQVSKD